ncbi:MAG: alpha/beta hydrolase [Pseudomonadota bacterium]
MRKVGLYVAYAVLFLIALLAGWLAVTGGSASTEREFPPIGELINVGGGVIHLTDEGAGPAVVLIHGASGNVRDFTFLLTKKLSSRYRVIAVDRPGHGYSSRPAKDGSNPEIHAEMIAEALRKVGVEQALIVGHSMGGAASVALLLNEPDLARGYLALSAVSHPWSGGVSSTYRYSVTPLLGPIMRRLAAGRINDIIASIFAPHEPPDGYLDYVGAPLALRSGTFKYNARDVLDLKSHLDRMSPRYGELNQPIEIVHGEHDDIVSVEVSPKGMHRDAPNTTLTILPGVGHMPHHEAEDEVIAILDRLATKSELAP